MRIFFSPKSPFSSRETQKCTDKEIENSSDVLTNFTPFLSHLLIDFFPPFELVEKNDESCIQCPRVGTFEILNSTDWEIE